MKKRMILKTAVILTLMLCVMLTGTKAKAAYTYKVTMSGGLYGTVSKTSDTFEYGKQWNPNDYTVTVTNDKYYFQGWHIAGQEGLVGTTAITQDTDFVAQYGIKGEVVAYTVNYLGPDGSELAPGATFYGNVGDKPVVAFVYVEGYQPQAYNLTKTLTGNAADNVFTFEYTEATATVVEETAGRTGAGGGTGTGTGTGAAAGEGENPGEAQDNENQGTVIEENAAPLTPADSIDLDDNDTPKENGTPNGQGGGNSGGTDVKKNGLSRGAAIGIAAGAAAVLVGAGVLAFLLARKRKED